MAKLHKDGSCATKLYLSVDIGVFILAQTAPSGQFLEARFDFALLRDQLAKAGINTMKPFSDFPFLRQAFTEGERWAVREERLQKLLSAGLITKDQALAFKNNGAVGSHLENLERKGGFKGFNQRSVSVIIKATDPRSIGPDTGLLGQGVV